jgi:hypothetical protein
MNPIIPEQAKELAGPCEPAEVLSIYAAMQQLTDSRRKQGRRSPLALILTYVLLAKAAGETTLLARAEWIRLRGAWLTEVVPEAGPSFPCAATSSNVLRATDPVQLNQVLMDLLTRVRAKTRKRGEQQIVAVDGKTLRGTLSHLTQDQKPMHQVTLYETQTGIVLCEHIVGDKENELSQIEEVLKPQWIKGRRLRGDALSTQRAFCLGVRRALGDYLLVAKGNQPSLSEDLRLFFTEPPVDCRSSRTASTWEKGHGRMAWRDLIASTERECVSGKPVAGRRASLLLASPGLETAGLHAADRLRLDQFDATASPARAAVGPHPGTLGH